MEDPAGRNLSNDTPRGPGLERRPYQRRIRIQALALACAACIGNAGAADWNATGVWLLHGNTFEPALGARERTITRLERADGWKYGDNYFFADFVKSTGNTAAYAELEPRLWLDAGALWGAPGHLEVGVEYFWWQDKYGIEGVDEEVVEPAVKWTF